MNRYTAVKAAKWWVEKIKRKEPHSNGADDPQNMLAMMFADFAANEAKVERDAYKKFEEYLAENILEGVVNSGSITFGCDYHPDIILAEAAEKAGVPEEIFPFKTFMEITNDTISVREGYGASYVKI